MNHRSRRRSALTAVAGLLMAGVAVGVTSAAVQAAPGTLPVTNACLSNATTTYSDLVWTLKGTVTPNTVTRGDTVTLTNSSVVVDIPATLLIAGYNLGLLTVGDNAIPTTIFVAREATNVDTGGGVKGTVTKVDQFTITANTFITDTPGPTPTDPHVVTATPLNINQPLPDFTVTTLGGNVDFRQGGTGSIGNIPVASVQQANPGPPPVPAYPTTPIPVAGGLWASASVAGGVIRANFDCSAGTTNISPVPGTSGPTFTPAASIAPFETVNVVAPPTAPTCTAEAPSVGVTQSITINLNDNCSDDNEAQGGGSPFTFTVSTPSAGTLTPTATAGVYTYAAPAVDPGQPVVISFTATDSGTPALTSTSTDITIRILANQCDATAGSCDLTQIVVQNVVGTTMTLDKVPGVVAMSEVTLNGAPQVSTGALNTLTVTNARGTAAAWSVTAYATDLGAAGTPTFTVPVAPGATVPLCSLAGAGPFSANPALAATINADRLCIPGDNLGWSPAAVVAHSAIPGDVAEVAAGTASAASADAWLAALVAAGNANDPGVGVDGLGGLGSINTLCSAPVNHSGGTFTCNAALYLGVPASAAAGTYQGGIVLTLA